MLYHVKMDVNIPRDIPLETVEAIKAAEKNAPPSCRRQVNGRTCGASWGSTRTSASSMWKATMNYMHCCRACRCSPS